MKCRHHHVNPVLHDTALLYHISNNIFRFVWSFSTSKLDSFKKIWKYELWGTGAGISSDNIRLSLLSVWQENTNHVQQCWRKGKYFVLSSWTNIPGFIATNCTLLSIMLRDVKTCWSDQSHTSECFWLEQNFLIFDFLK